ncbi:MAG: hypothetical protein JKY52_19300 [Flavobacteriales bacterium]|nr:hypothetical protein [Flavobacteriales bacterium]
MSLITKLLVVGLVCGVLGGGYGLYLFNMPHRDVQAVAVFAELDASILVAEFLNDANTANEKYLDATGESKVLLVSGVVDNIEIDGIDQKVILLKNSGDQAGVSCTFTLETNAKADKIQVGESISVKGVIRSGAEIDTDFDLVEDVILEKCDIVK